MGGRFCRARWIRNCPALLNPTVNPHFSYFDFSASICSVQGYSPIPHNAIDEIRRLVNNRDFAQLQKLNISEVDGEGVALLCLEIAQQAPEAVQVLARHPHVSLAIHQLLEVKPEGADGLALKKALNAEEPPFDRSNEMIQDNHLSTKITRQLKPSAPDTDLKNYLQGERYKDLEKVYVEGFKSKKERATVMQMVEQFGASAVVEFFLGALTSKAINGQQLAQLMAQPASVNGTTCTMLNVFINQDPRCVQNLYVLLNQLKASDFGAATLKDVMTGSIRLGADHLKRLASLIQKTWLSKAWPKLLTVDALGTAMQQGDRQLIEGLYEMLTTATMPSANVAEFLSCKQALKTAIDGGDRAMVEAYADLVLRVQKNPKTRMTENDAWNLKKVINCAHMELDGFAGFFSIPTNTKSYENLKINVPGIAQKFSDAKDTLKTEFYLALRKK